ncbi:hypothetical protein U9M48_008872 [Paspalum notatum var. saurae]|uniref:Reverse transcriptase domain-containing protein n=1 Tax=Paspalum notatum var. saurae TaxID=547442 RepID=A0AAQ3SPY0_PASNO
MPSIPQEVAEHSLNIRPSARLVAQRLCRFDEEKRRAIGEEIAMLLAIGFIKEVHHLEWIANPILVKKKNGKWRMCVDYTSLNKACPKDPFPLPRIDQVVDSTIGCELLSLLDAYSGYHQIAMKESDHLATSFITHFVSFCYVSIPFGLKNTGATSGDLIADLEETFANLRRFNIKLNPEKCVFGVPKGKLLGFMVSERSIEANKEKVDAIQRMGPIKNLKGVQQLVGCLAALSRFVSRLGEARPVVAPHFVSNALGSRRSDPPSLQAPQEGGSLLLDPRGTGSAGSDQGVSNNTPGAGGSLAG